MTALAWWLYLWGSMSLPVAAFGLAMLGAVPAGLLLAAWDRRTPWTLR